MSARMVAAGIGALVLLGGLVWLPTYRKSAALDAKVGQYNALLDRMKAVDDSATPLIAQENMVEKQMAAMKTRSDTASNPDNDPQYKALDQQEKALQEQYDAGNGNIGEVWERIDSVQQQKKQIMKRYDALPSYSTDPQYKALDQQNDALTKQHFGVDHKREALASEAVRILDGLQTLEDFQLHYTEQVRGNYRYYVRK